MRIQHRFSARVQVNVDVSSVQHATGGGLKEVEMRRSGREQSAKLRTTATGLQHNTPQRSELL